MRFAEDYKADELRRIDAIYKRKADGEDLDESEVKTLNEYESAMQAQQHEYETVNKIISNASAAMVQDAMEYTAKLKAAYDELRKSQIKRIEEMKQVSHEQEEK